MAADPLTIGLTGDRLDDQTQQAEAVVGVFHAAVRRDHRRLGQGGAQLGLAGEGAAVEPLTGVGAVTHQTGAVG